MTDRAKVADALEERMTSLLASSPRAMHPLWNYIISDLVPILRWTEIYCNSSRVLAFIQRLLKLPPLTFAYVAFAGLFIALKKCLKLDPRLTTNLLAVAYPTVVSLQSLEHTNWLTYWCIYAWSTLTDQITPLLQDPVKSYYIPKMLFFYWMSAKGGSSMLYQNVITRVLKTKSNSAAQIEDTDTACDVGVSDHVEMTRSMKDEEVDDSILESVQESDNDQCTFSDHDSDVGDGSSDKETLANVETESVVVTKEFKTLRDEIKFTMSSIKVNGTLDRASEAAE